MWQNYFNKIFVINLKRRTDRLQRVTEVMNEYDINAFIYEAIEHEDGRLGLVMSMKKLFTQCLESGYEHVLIFEDDAEMVECVDVFNTTMNNCVSWLQNNYFDMFYLGLQHVRTFGSFITPNILPVSMGYSTHAVAYSKHAMQFIIDRPIAEPVDNYLVREFQPMNTCYCSYPLLVTQADTYSDICKANPNFNEVIRFTFEEFTRDVLPFRNNCLIK